MKVVTTDELTSPAIAMSSGVMLNASCWFLNFVIDSRDKRYKHESSLEDTLYENRERDSTTFHGSFHEHWTGHDFGAGNFVGADAGCGSAEDHDGDGDG